MVVKINNVKMFDELTKLAKKHGYNVEVIGEPDYIKLSTESMEIVVQLKENGARLDHLELHDIRVSLSFDDEQSMFRVYAETNRITTEVKTKGYQNELFIPSEDLEKFLVNPGYYTFTRLGVYMPIDTDFFVRVRTLLL